MTTSLIIGLGNPGSDYAGNRHNVGFMALDAIAAAHGFGIWKKAKGGELAEGLIAGKKTYLFKPMSYMNLSGNPAGELSRFYKITPALITVIHDELDLPLCKIRVKRGGGHGGHNGLKSLDEHLGKDYQRVRFGIDHPGNKDDVADYVLRDFSKAEREKVDACNIEIARNIAQLLGGDEAGFMNKITLAFPEMKETKEAKV